MKGDSIASEVNEQVLVNETRRLAEAVRTACVKAALEGYERAAISGLCHEGAWESAIDAMGALNLETIIQGIEAN
jgi:hypothetical protein